ncbi:MAG TPA: serine/threonine-protein kinase, partial [Polyangiaceae bacterium]
MAEPAPVNPGDVLAGKYRVERVLGMGGMGVVVAATHLELGQLVALKFLLPAAELNAEATARFIREARAAVRISSEHVARVTDVGRLENGAPYMVMEYLEGVDLGEHVKGAHLPIDAAADFVLQACEAIAVAHALGIVHRDLKPANLFVTIRPDGTPLIKVLDFGISKVVGINEQNPSLTKTSAVMGSPLYMSPEQMRSARNVDARADIWSLGTILHELIAGSPPFGGETLGEVFSNVMTVEATPLRVLRPETPERLERLVQRALEKDPARRIANVGDLAAALAEFAPARSRALVARVQGVLQRAGLASSTPELPQGAVDLGTPAAAGVAATDTSWAD